MPVIAGTNGAEPAIATLGLVDAQRRFPDAAAATAEDVAVVQLGAKTGGGALV